MPLFEIELPDGRVLEIERPDENAARERARQFLAAEQGPQAPAEDNRPLMGPGQALVRGFRTGVGGGVQGLGMLGQYFGLPGGQTIRGVGDAIVGEAPEGTRGVELSDFGRQPLRAIGALGGEVAGNLAGLFGTGLGVGLATRGAARLAGAGAAAAGRAGSAATVGSIAGSGSLAGVPDLEQSLIAEGVSPERALELAALIGPVIGAGETAGPLALLQRALGRNVSQATAQAIVAAGARRSIGHEVAVGAGTEALSEAAGDAARQAVVAAETGNLNLADRAAQVAVGAIGGALGGGAMGVPLGASRFSRARQQVAAEEASRPSAPSTEAPPEPERPPPIPPPPEAFTTVEEAQAFARQNGGEGRAPVDLATDPEGYVAWANSLQTQNYEQAVERQRGNELSRFIGANRISDVRGQPDTQGNTQIETDFQIQRDTLYKNLIRAAGQQKLDLNNFSVDDVVRAALEPLEVDDPTPNERGFVRDTMNNLVQQGLLLRGDRGKWRIKPLDVGALEAQEWERQKAAQQKPPTPSEPTLPELDEERRKLRAHYPELLRLEDEAKRTQELMDFLATPDAEAFLRDLLKNETKPGTSYKTWQKAFKAETGVDLTPEQGGLLHGAAQKLGLISQLNQIDGRILAANARAKLKASGAPVAPTAPVTPVTPVATPTATTVPPPAPTAAPAPTATPAVTPTTPTTPKAAGAPDFTIADFVRDEMKNGENTGPGLGAMRSLLDSKIMSLIKAQGSATVQLPNGNVHTITGRTNREWHDSNGNIVPTVSMIEADYQPDGDSMATPAPTAPKATPAPKPNPKTVAPPPAIPPAPPPKVATGPRPAFAPSVPNASTTQKPIEKRDGGGYVVNSGPLAGNVYPSYNQALKAMRGAEPKTASNVPTVKEEPPEASQESLFERTRKGETSLEAKGGVNAQGLLRLLGPSLYGSIKDIAQVSAKELMQNSYDAVKSAIATGKIKKGKIDFRTSNDAYTMSITDNGVGMTPQVLSTKFLEIASSGKEGKNNSGGFGIAKILFLYGSENIHVITMRDGKVAEMRTTGAEISATLQKGRGPTITVREPTAADRRMFPDGHGTFVETTVPQTYKDPETEEQKPISRVQNYYDSKALMHSPLFADIDVRFNNWRVPNVGSDFPVADYTPFVNVKAPWGTGRLYVSKAADGSKYGENLHVLSNGLWQYSGQLVVDPENSWSDNIPYTFYLDLKPTVDAHHEMYPFQPNRQGLKGDAATTIGRLLNYVNGLYAYESFAGQAKDFGSLAYVDPDSGRISTAVNLSPEIKTTDTTFSTLAAGSQATVKDGKLFIDGKELPDLPVKQLAALIPKATDLKIDPSLIDPSRAMIHDNMLVDGVPYGTYMRQKFGARFDEYLAHSAETFRLLRDEVARVMGYSGLMQEGVGVSIDRQYRGVSIRVPFSASFVNPAAAEAMDSVEAGFGIVGTMVHELAHFKVRSHDASFPQEMQRITYKLEAAPDFDFAEFKRDFAQTFDALFGDIHAESYRLFHDTGVKLTTPGNRLAGSEQGAISPARNAGLSDGERGNGRSGGTGQSLFSNFAPSYQAVGQGNAGGRPPPSNAPPLSSGPLTPPLPAAPAAAKATTKQMLGDQITGTMRWFASPITTMPALKPALRPAADVQHGLAARRSEVLQTTEESLKSFLGLSPEAQVRVTRAWEQASRTRKAPDYSKMDAKEAAALKELVGGPQEALNYYIESAAWKHFDPEAAKTPQQKAKLEAFWKKHEGKHLWQIPEAERRAVSPDGMTAMSQLERIRNPFYMPMIAQGSHFVAAYEKDAKGQRKGGPVRMYAFTPLNGFQKMMGYADPHAQAVMELQREFGGKAKFELRTEATQFTSDAEARDIRGKGDFIASYLEKLADVKGMQTAEAQRVLARMTDQLNKAEMERIFRTNQDVLQPITSYNEGSYVLDVMPRYFAGMASIIARRHTQDAWARALAPLSVNDKSYLNDLRDYSTTPTEAFGGLRTLAFVWLMGYAPDTALVNALQPIQVTAPMMIRDGGIGSLKYMKDAYNHLIKHVYGAALKLENIAKHLPDTLTDPDEKDAVERALKIGTMSPLYTDESKGQVTVEGMRKVFGANANKAATKINSAVRMAGTLQQTAEQLNRMVTFLAAYRMAKADPSVIANSNRFNNTDIKGPDAAYEYATKMVQDTQFVTTKEDRAYFQRFMPGAELMTQFMSFPAKTVELFARHFLKVLPGAIKEDPAAARAGALGFMMMMAPMIGLAGVWSLPFAESLREIFEKIAGLAWGSTQNFDADMKRFMGGGALADFVARGGPHAMGWISLSRRLAIDPLPYQELTTSNALSLLGPAGSIPEAYVRAAERAKHGDYMNMLALMLPRAAGNVLKALDLEAGTQEYRSDRGRTLVSQEQLDRMSGDLMLGRAGIAVRQAMGFQTPQVTNQRDLVLRAEEIDKQNLRATEDLNSDVARHLTTALRLQQQGKASEAQAEYNAITERLRQNDVRNIDAVRRERYDLVIRPNISAIRRRAEEDLLGLSDPNVMLRRTSPSRRLQVQQEMPLYN